MSSNVIKLPPLLERLGSMTAIRDTELLEQSLLKTLGAVLGVNDMSLYKTDEYQRCVGVLNHHRSVVLDREQRLFVDERPLPLEALERALAEIARAEPDTEVLLRVDAAVPYGRVAALIGQVQGAGLSRIGFVAEPGQTPAPTR